jgi:exonuclease SbcD
MVGGLPRTSDGLLDFERLLAPLHDAQGEVTAWVAAVPYLRIADLRTADLARLADVDDPLIEGVRQVYAEAIDAARERRTADQALVAMGHCYMTDSQVSEMSERRILGGNQHALPVDIFPPEVAYVALGHLHLPQRVGSERVRYSGSPIPLSLAERGYRHQVLLVDLEQADLVAVTPLIIPRAVDLLRVPERDALPLDEILPLLEALPGGVLSGDVLSGGGNAGRETWPFLEVHVRLSAPEPSLRAEVENALEGRRVRLVRLHPTYTGTGAALGDGVRAKRLDELRVEDVFKKCWERQYQEQPDKDVLEAFDELLEQVHQGET